MEFRHLEDAVKSLEKANADLQPELLSAPDARGRLEAYARARKLLDYGIAALAARIDDAPALARATGTSVPKACETIATGSVLRESAPLDEALRSERCPWTRRARSPRPRRPLPDPPASSSRWPTRNPSL